MSDDYWDESPPPEEPDHGDPYEDIPPPEDPPEDAAPASRTSASRDGSPRARTQRDRRMHAEVLDVLRSVLAALHRRPTSDAATIITTIAANPKVLGELTPEVYEIYKGVLEVLSHECSTNPTGILDMRVLPLLPVVDAYHEDVKAEIEAVGPYLDSVKGSASSLWEGIRENVQRTHSRRAMAELIELIDQKANVDRLMEVYQKVEPPTARKALTHDRSVKTAREIAAERKAMRATRAHVRFSSGYRTLDMAFTAPREPIGFIAPGEQAVVAGMTGTGKSSFSYGLVCGLAQDLVNWGFPNAYLIWFHTEEESADKIAAAGLEEGDRFHHLADNIVVDAVGTSRQRMAEVLYDLVIEAKKKSEDTGRAIEQFLPHIVVLDYIQSILGEKDGDATKATITTAEFLLRGVQAWNPEEMAKFSGVDFRSYAGMAWPEGMENHRVAVITFAQLNKQDDRIMSYKPSSKDHPLSDFTIEDNRPTPAWKDPGGGGWLFEVKEGDQRILKQNAISGSSVILKNATIILFLHRSRPYNNPGVTGPDGKKHLEDTRARLIPDKTRNGAAMKSVPMAFDIHDVGKEVTRARYFDRAAERAIAEGRFTPDETWREPGDPILPRRPKARPLSGVLY